jgi:hypothetical protein
MASEGAGSSDEVTQALASIHTESGKSLLELG